MSDQPENTEEAVVAEETFDVAAATEDDLRTRAAELRSQIDDLEQQPLTLAVGEQIAALRMERNNFVDAVNSLITLTADPIADADLVDIPVVDDAPATEDATVSDTEEAVVADTDTEVLADAAEQALVDAGAAHVASAERSVAPAVPARPKVAYVAGAGQTRFTQGTELDASALAEAWESRRRDLRPGVDGSPVRAVVANLPAFESMSDLSIDSLSHDKSSTQNDRLIGESIAAWRASRNGEPMSAHTAAICDPLDIIREIPTDGETVTPFADLFPQRPIGRLGFTYTPASALSVAASGVGVWTESDQDGVDPDDSSTWKPTVLIECTSPLEVKAEELTTSAIVDTSTEMSSPERVAEFMFKLAVARARQREQYLLGEFDGTASAYTLTATYGALSGLVQGVHTVLPQLLYGERLPETDYDLVLDPGFLNKLTIDLFNEGNREAQEAAVDVIRRHIGLNVVVLRDFVGASSFQTPPTPGAGASALTALPSANRVRLVPAGAYIYGATGEESTGWQTDPQLARQNRMQAFSAEWLMLAKHGSHKAAYIDITSTASGYLGGVKAMP